MSIKAYDGMMTRNGLKYIQDEITKRLPLFKEASENKLAEEYIKLFVKYVDKKYDIKGMLEFDAINDPNALRDIKDIKIDNDTTVLSYIYQASKILSKSNIINDFSVDLHITLDCINDKILIYPAINVKEHRTLLLEFLTDWYYQNQCDRDERVSEEEWAERSKEWWDFNETRGLSIKILLFDPSHFWNSLNNNFRGDELIDKMLQFIPDDSARIRSIAKDMVIKNIDEELKASGEDSRYWTVINRLTKEGNTEIQDYIDSNEIILTKIDKEFIKTKKLNENI